MTQRYRSRSVRREVGWALASLAMIVWAVSETLRFDAHDEEDVSIQHFVARALGVIGGGAAVAGGIVLLATAA